VYPVDTNILLELLLDQQTTREVEQLLGSLCSRFIDLGVMLASPQWNRCAVGF